MKKPPRKIAICGATGMVGSQLALQLRTKGHRPALVGRDASKVQAYFPFEVDALNWDGLSETDPAEIATIVNLAGAGVSDQKGTIDRPFGDPKKLSSYVAKGDMTKFRRRLEADRLLDQRHHRVVLGTREEPADHRLGLAPHERGEVLDGHQGRRRLPPVGPLRCSLYALGYFTHPSIPEGN